MGGESLWHQRESEEKHTWGGQQAPEHAGRHTVSMVAHLFECLYPYWHVQVLSLLDLGRKYVLIETRRMRRVIISHA